MSFKKQELNKKKQSLSLIKKIYYSIQYCKKKIYKRLIEKKRNEIKILFIFSCMAYILFIILIKNNCFIPFLFKNQCKKKRKNI